MGMSEMWLENQIPAYTPGAAALRLLQEHALNATGPLSRRGPVAPLITKFRRKLYLAYLSRYDVVEASALTRLSHLSRPRALDDQHRQFVDA
jgi:hypothetical protein